jgi:hypothetical protein
VVAVEAAVLKRAIRLCPMETQEMPAHQTQGKQDNQQRQAQHQELL